MVTFVYKTGKSMSAREIMWFHLHVYHYIKPRDLSIRLDRPAATSMLQEV